VKGFEIREISSVTLGVLSFLTADGFSV